MKPFKATTKLANWLLRIVLIINIYNLHVDHFLNFQFAELSFYISAFLVIFAALLFAGGFFSKPDLTVLSGLIIFMVALLWIVIHYHGDLNNMMMLHLMATVIGFYFLSTGNK